MAMSTGGKGRGSLSEINVTPLVDVMLVLLIVFMVTTPIIVADSQREVPLDLPQTNSNTPVQPDEMQTIIFLHADFRVGIDTGAQDESELANCQGVAEGAFGECLAPVEDRLKNNPLLKDVSRVYIMADRKLPYGFVIDVMARLRNAGLVNLGMVTNPQDGKSG
ncbi:MAG: biopolymer transporter ExbD [bacterium]